MSSDKTPSPAICFAQRLKDGKPIETAILLFPDVEVLDFAGPFEVFSVANRVWAKRPDVNGSETASSAAFDITPVAATADAVTARHGLGIMPAADFASAKTPDLLIVPGGIVTEVLKDQTTLAYLRKASANAALTASVCTGAFLLAEIGLLAGARATTHWEDIPELRTNYPEITVLEDVPFVDLGNVVTSAGISAGIGMSLHIVARILGPEIATATARQMQYDWREDQNSPPAYVMA